MRGDGRRRLEFEAARALHLANRQELMLNFAPCARDNIEWAMDPWTSCIEPDCLNPYSRMPNFMFQNSDTDRVPPFVDTTMSFVPDCNSGGTEPCLGMIPNTFTGEGVQFASDTIDAYKMDPGPYNIDGDTTFVNILITDGATSGGSVDPEPILVAMATDGVDTYVIGFGTPADLNETQLDAYAVAGERSKALSR